MPSPFPHLAPEHRGTVTVERLRVRSLEGNALGDPADRDVHVYRPRGADPADVPVVTFLAAYSATGEKFFARGFSDLPIQARLDALFAAGTPPFVALFPDVMTRLGGSQFVDSPILGGYGTWIADDLPAWARSTLGLRGPLGLVGKSSGGFGALHLALGHPGRFDAVASHAGDLGFDLCYLGDLAPALRAWHAAGGVERFVEAFWRKEDPSSADFAGLNLLAMSCAYTDRPFDGALTPHLPVNPTTGEVRFDVLHRWRRFDPCARDLTPLRSLRGVYVDVGDRDEYGLQFGARRFSTLAEAAGVALTYAEYPGGHRGNASRWDVSLDWIGRRLAEAASAR